MLFDGFAGLFGMQVERSTDEEDCGSFTTSAVAGMAFIKC